MLVTFVRVKYYSALSIAKTGQKKQINLTDQEINPAINLTGYKDTCPFRAIVVQSFVSVH